MIHSIEDTEEADEAPRIEIRRRTAAFFAPGGMLERGSAGEEFPYERRPQQEQMADAVAEALEEGRPLAVEAGTGVGKSFAYLVPLILATLARGGKSVVSTYTISLQEQLMSKDIPFLRAHLGVDFKAVLMKGKGNYVCLRRLARAERMGADLFRTAEMTWLARLRAWAETTEEGSLQDLREQPPSALWSSVCVEEGNCSGQKCGDFRRCFFMTARRRVNQADLIVANHHLLFADLALRRQEAALLPDYDALVLDEAHQIENAASEHLGLRLSQYMFEHWMRRLYQPDAQKGLLAIVKHSAGAHAVTQLGEEVARFYADLRTAAHFGAEDTQRVVPGPLALETGVPARILEIAAHVREILKDLEDEDLKAELKQARARGLELRESLLAFLEQGLDDQVYWLETEGRRRQVVMYSAPIEVGPILRERLFGAVPCVIMTSATLAVNGKLDFFLHRVGADACPALAVGSPFDYARQMRVLLPERMPDPNQNGFVPAAAAAVLFFARKTAGCAFVLFTSGAMMRRVADRVREPLARDGLQLLVQGEALARSVMLEEFRKGQGTVLFGLDSFWMGVDVRGEALSNVMIVRLPFAVPDQPLTKARMDRIQQRGGDAFKEFSLPEAVIKFRQGVGRLIRTATDTGIVVVLDRRIVDKWYGRWFLRSIPECPVEVVEVPPPLEGDAAPEGGEA